MKHVASLRYGVIFKKAFCDVEVFTQFVKDFTGVQLEIDKVETEKSFDSPIGNVDSRFDLYAQDLKNRVIVDIQHQHFADHYHRFLHYHCAALLEQVSRAKNYQPALRVFTIVVLTSGNKYDSAIATIHFDPIDLVTQKPLGEIEHKVLYVTPKHLNSEIPEPYHEWLRAIADSLDEQVEESDYHNPVVLKVFDLIQRDGLTPKDRARLKDEYSVEEANQAREAQIFAQGVTQGVAQGIAQGERNMQYSLAKKLLQQGQLDLVNIATATGLTIEELNSL